MAKARDRSARGGNGRYFIDNVFFRANWARVVGPYGIAVYSVLALHANADTQTCWPSYQTIADLSGMTRVQAINIAIELEQRHIIEIERHKGKSNTFRLLHHDEWGQGVTGGH